MISSFVAHSNEKWHKALSLSHLNADNTDTDDYARFTATIDLLTTLSIIGKARPLPKIKPSVKSSPCY